MVEQASKIGNGAVLISIRSTVDFRPNRLVSSTVSRSCPSSERDGIKSLDTPGLNSISLSSLRRVTFLPEGVIVGFRNFAWGFNSQKN